MLYTDILIVCVSKKCEVGGTDLGRSPFGDPPVGWCDATVAALHRAAQMPLRRLVPSTQERCEIGTLGTYLEVVPEPTLRRRSCTAPEH
ncbi:MAG: hypothetical protein KatS3mg083_083 [Candidatus Dojkabacteria bacterium]|nr:MAG: hypothetical protein KatS3mg083_083 [Candidatus Dojkabacteria bacterium]